MSTPSSDLDIRTRGKPDTTRTPSTNCTVWPKIHYERAIAARRAMEEAILRGIARRQDLERAVEAEQRAKRAWEMALLEEAKRA